MPAKNSIKEFVSDSFYHLYNRGVEKRIIFNDEQDYTVFLSYLKTYLVPKDIVALQKTLKDPDVSWKIKDRVLKELRLNNFAGDVILVSYCLMPNHFHILVKQHEAESIDRFMNSLCTRYAMYFNRKHKRVGVLFQDHYKAVRITTDEQLLHLSRYIHNNPSKLTLQGAPLQSYMYSSYQDYLGLKHTSWVASNMALDFFKKNTGSDSYQSFVEGNDESAYVILKMTIDEEI